jgi:hypothetical protein
MYAMVVAAVPSSSEQRLTEAWVMKASSQDVYIDSLFIGRGPTTDDTGK